MIKAKVIFGTYNTQSPNETSMVIEDMYQKAYKTFLTTLYNYSEINLCLYYGGSLLEWIDENHSEFNSVLLEMTNRKQAELLGGSFYDSPLTLVPMQDRVGQLEKQTTYIRKNFGKKPRGCFLSENIWDSSLVSSLKSCGFDYIYLDENQFLSAGIPNNKIFEPVITEDQGKIITVIPLSTTITNMLFRSTPREVVDYIIDKSHMDGVFTILFKGEYFLSRELSVKDMKAWLEEFLKLLVENNHLIETISPGKYVKSIQGELNRAYFPQYSINGMRNKPLPIVSQRELFRLNRHLGALGDVSHWINSGFFKQFLARYRDSALIYSKMMYINLLSNQIKGDKSKKKSAREKIWKSQSHFVYWHGIHLGIYDKNLREMTYRDLLDAENLTREKGIFKSGINYYDIDMDGRKEALFQSEKFNAYISDKGGVLFELDWFKTRKNLISTVMRMEETYHGVNDKDLGFDSDYRKMFHDYFFDKELTLSNFSRRQLNPLINLNYIYNVEKINKDGNSVEYNIRESVNGKNFPIDINLNKLYSFSDSGITLSYIIENLGDIPLRTTFGTEFNLSLSNGAEGIINKVRNIDLTREPILESNAVKLEILEVSQKMSFEFSRVSKCILISPQRSTSLNNGILETYYQFTSFMTLWDIEISPRENWILSIKLGIN